MKQNLYRGKGIDEMNEKMLSILSFEYVKKNIKKFRHHFYN